MEDKLSPEELQRYSRHLTLPEYGAKGQLALKKTKVIVVGAGGLGTPVLSYLTAAGVGEIGITEFDVVSLSNLQRQVFYNTEDIGKPKAIVMATRLKSLNPNVKVNIIGEKITRHNVLEIIKGYDLIVDCTDNFPTRYLINDAAVLLNLPLVYGSVFRYEGQVAVLNYKGGPNYRDLYPVPPAPGSVPDCEQGGVLGVLPSIIGSLQANEVIKLLTGKGETLAGKLLLFDSQTLETRIIKIPDHGERSKIRELIDYDDFCGLSQKKKENCIMKEVTVQELKELIDSKADFQLIDVREPHEYEISNINGELIPLAEVPHNVDKIARDKQVVIHCRSGKRSSDALTWLEKNHGFENLYNLKGGILAWAKEIDPSLPTS